MVPSNLNFWSISRKETRESQQKHALRKKCLRTILCSTDIFIPVYNRKMLMRKRTSFLDIVCFNFEQLLHPRQCTTCRICQCSSKNKLALPEVTGILSISDELHYASVINGFDKRYTTIFNITVSVWKFTHTFRLPL